MIARFALPLVLFLLLGCKNHKISKLNYYAANNKSFVYQGRVVSNNKSSALITSAASVECNIKGDSVTLHIQSSFGPRNYVVIAINDEYYKRFKLESDSIHKVPIHLSKNKTHKIGVFKATESSNGEIIFHGIEAKDLIAIKEQKPYTIEFIGNSITCGAAADLSDVPCGAGEYLDQHNAYLAYGPRIARKLNTNFMLSAVSGIGIYRNWNDENIEEPIMPQVYENLYLNTDSTKKYDFAKIPDVVSICLGTNDLSDGDGVKPRLDFNKQKFIDNYTGFIETVYAHYPNVKIAILTSPMISGERGKLLLECLQNVKGNFEENNVIEIFEFEAITPNGCTSHPDINDHKKMAEQLVPFFKNLLNK